MMTGGDKIVVTWIDKASVWPRLAPKARLLVATREISGQS